MGESSVTSETLDRYLVRLRAGLRGVPRPDVEDIVQEIRSHLADHVAGGGSPEQAVAELGPAGLVAEEIIQRRMRPEGSPPVPDAPASRRAAAWCVDFVVGGVLLLLNPSWFVVLGAIQERFWMDDRVRAQLAAMPEYVSMTGGVGWALTALMVGSIWAAFYWLYLRRTCSVSVGMRMSGISRISTSDGVRVVRTSDIAEGEPARIVARPKWYLALPVVPVALIAALVMLELAVMTVGSFLQPFNPMLPTTSAEAEHADSQAVVEAFYDAILAGDAETAASYVADGATFNVDALVADRAEDGIESWTFGPGVPPGDWYVVETLRNGKRRTVVVSVMRAEETPDPGDITVRYRVFGCTDDPLNRGVADPE